MEFFFFGLAILGVCGVISTAIGTGKGRSGVGSFLWGFLLGVIGIIVVAVLPPGTPAGMRPVTCSRCNARQNIKVGDLDYECWQCKARISVKPLARKENTREWLDRVKREKEQGDEGR